MTDLDAWEAVYATHRSTLVGYAAMLLGSTSAAEDAVAEAITTLLESPHLDIDDRVAYLRTTVVNRCRRELRRRGRLRSLDAADLRPHLDESHIELLDAVLGLTRRRRTAVLLRYYLDLPVGGIAELMGCAPSTVSSLLHRAMKDLKEVLS